MTTLAQPPTGPTTGPPAGAPTDAPTEAGTLADRFDALGQFVRVTWAHVAADPDVSDVDAAAVAAAGVLSERAGARLRLSGDHTVVALAGATGSGKSSLFNALARMDLSPAGYLRPTTGATHACVWGDQNADALLNWLGVSNRFRRESALDARDQAPLHGLVLLDLPDLDSVATGHRLEADRLVGVVDLVVWVLDPQKYADRTVHEEYLRRMGPLHDVTVVVFNQIDRLSSEDAQRCVVDLTRLVEADGLPGMPVLATSAVTGAGVDQLQARLESAIAGRHVALARLEAELDEAVDGLIPLVGAESPARPEDPLGQEAVAALGDQLADAGGVSAVAAQAARGYERRAALPGWPFRSHSTGAGSGAGRASGKAIGAVPPADPAAVAVAVRRLAAQAGAGLPVPWPDQIHSAVAADLDHLPDELGRSLTLARPPLPGRSGWIAVRTVWWLAVAAALAGGGWLGWHAWRGTARPASLYGISAALLLAALGVLVAVVLPLVGRPLARSRATRYRTAVRARMRDQLDVVAQEVLAPARNVLREYGVARAALQAAASRRRAGGG